MPSVKKLLFVDDNDTLRELLHEQFELCEEFEVTEASRGASALELVKRNYYDILLLDISLPDIDGCDLCRLIRKRGIKVPIIMLTEVNTDVDTILGASAGANDYITKPFRFNVLMARIRAHIRQHKQSEDVILAIGPYVFYPASKMLIENKLNRKIHLTDKETSILKFLYHAGDTAVSRSVLLDKVWGYNAEITTHTLETYIYRLRQKIELDPANARILVTQADGYKLVL